MTAVQLNAEMLRSMRVIAEDENLLRRAVKYLRKLVAEKQADPTCFTQAEYFQKLDRSLEQAKRGEVQRMLPEESLEDFLKRVG